MKFNSQICTTREQSERLIALGLKKETADMCYRYVNTVKGEKKYELIVEAAWSQEVIDEYVRFGTKIGLFDNLVHPCGKPVTPLEARADVTKNDIPAWSLHRLIEMADTTTYINEGREDEHELWFCMDKCYCWNNHESFYSTNLYDSLINCIEWLIKEGYFNKEYLV